jgi:hypothetical protein
MQTMAIEPPLISQPRLWAKLGSAFAVCLTLCWLGWAHVARERLRREIDAISQAGEPVYPTDLDLSPIPDAVNAAYYYKAAFATVSVTAICPAASNLTYPNYPPYPPIWHQMANQAVAANSQALALARQARNFDRVDWGIRFGSPFSIRPVLPNLNSDRNLANLLGDAALQAHFRGDDAEAFQRIFDVLHLADAVQQHGFLVGRLVGIGIEALAAERLQVIALDLHVKGQSRSATAVSRDDVLKLIDLLLDDSRENRQIHEMMLEERVVSLDESRIIEAQSTVLRPMVQLATADFLQKVLVIFRAEAAPNWAQSQANYSALGPGLINFNTSSPNPPRFSRFPGFFFSPMPRYFLTECRVTNERRTAAISLAANLYRLDHGYWPANLQALVGEYLPAVPDDPFCAGHQPTGYVIITLPSGIERPMLYSEPSGSPTTQAPSSLPRLGWQNTKPEDARQWHDISPWWTASTPQTVDHQPNQPGQHGK